MKLGATWSQQITVYLAQLKSLTMTQYLNLTFLLNRLLINKISFFSKFYSRDYTPKYSSNIALSLNQVFYLPKRLKRYQINITLSTINDNVLHI